MRNKFRRRAEDRQIDDLNGTMHIIIDIMHKLVGDFDELKTLLENLHDKIEKGKGET